jgi:hypothetical protein
MMFLFGDAAYSSHHTSLSPFLQLLWAWIGSTRQMYKMCHSTGDIQLAESYIVQDVILPTKSAAVALTSFNTDESYHMWPLWICPIRKLEVDTLGLGIPLTGSVGDLMFNLGFYGPVNGGRSMNPVQKNKQLEQKVFELKGKKWLYAQSFYTEEEFWGHFNKDTYDSLRKKYKNDAVFHNITEKVLLSSKTKDSICKECSINIWSYIHKVVPILCLGYLELVTPRSIQPWLGIDHAVAKEYYI